MGRLHARLVRKLFANDEMLKAARNSLFIAVVASALATVLGTMAGIAMHRYRLADCCRS